MVASVAGASVRFQTAAGCCLDIFNGSTEFPQNLLHGLEVSLVARGYGLDSGELGPFETSKEGSRVISSLRQRACDLLAALRRDFFGKFKLDRHAPILHHGPEDAKQRASCALAWRAKLQEGCCALHSAAVISTTP